VNVDAANTEPARKTVVSVRSERFWIGYLAVAGLPALFLVDAAVAFFRGWRIDTRYDAAIVCGLVVWTVAATLLAAVDRGRRFYGRSWRQLAALCGGCCLAWLLAELALPSVLKLIAEPFHCRRPGLEFVYYPQPGMMRDVGPKAVVRFNSLGVRGSEPPPRKDGYRILCVGGSSTACTYLDDSKAWPSLLEENLNLADASRRAWVGNVGMPSYRGAEHLRFIAESPVVDQVDCLILQTGVNDFMSCLIGPRPMPLWTKSRVRQLIRELVGRYTQYDDRVEDAAGQAYAARRQERMQAEVAEALPPVDECLARYEQILRDIIVACRRRQVRVVFTTQPVLWTANPGENDEALWWFGRLADGRYLSARALRAGMDRYDERLRHVCRSEHVELIDLSELDGNSAAFYDDAHFTETGARLVATKIAGQLQIEPPLAADRGP
jgi:lysophospholipase L1-like esterase